MQEDDIDLLAMTDKDFAPFIDRVVNEYANQSVAAGRVERNVAHDWARSETEKLLPDGIRTKNTHLFRIVSKQDPMVTLGSIWCSQDSNKPRNAFIYDLFVYPEHRRKGLAFAAMSKLETVLRGEGYESVGLHVYAHNEAAVRLYDKLSYKPTNMVLKKDLQQHTSED